LTSFPARSAAVTDGHVHVIADDPAHYPFSPRFGKLPEWLPERHQTAEKLVATLDAAGVEKAVLVQYASVHGYDNSYVVDTAARWPDRFVAVCAIDPAAADAADQASYWAEERGAAGLRIGRPAPAAPPAWVECPAVWRRAGALGLPLCVHFLPGAFLEAVQRTRAMMERFPDVRVVLDHVANPPWAEGPPLYGLAPVLELAHLNLVLKLATVNLERLDAAGVDPATVLRILVDRFGADRIMWGSDAPNTPGVYSEMVGRMRAVIAGLPALDQAAIMSGTARSVYPRLAEDRAAVRQVR
jgi:predicted TIM-barrel fold metal-dependent hydrolase